MMFGKKRISDLRTTIPLNEARKLARILVIDDDATAFPYELLQAEGYNVRYSESVDKLADLENGDHDIIVLDICGVSSPEISANGAKIIYEPQEKRDGTGCNDFRLTIPKSNAFGNVLGSYLPKIKLMK